MEAITIITAIHLLCLMISGKSINLSDLRMLFMAYKTLFLSFAYLLTTPPPKLPWIGVRAHGAGLQR